MLLGNRARILLTCLVAFAAVQSSLRASAQDGDLAIALSARSPLVVERELELEAARSALEVAEAGVSLSASVSPSLTFDRDLSPVGEVDFDADVALAAQLVYRYDQRARLTARLAVARAEIRVRTQRRTDVERALLALSALRLALRSELDARTELEAVGSRGTAPDGSRDLLAELEARSAALDLRAAEESVGTQRRLLADLGIAGSGALSESYFDVPRAVPASHSQAELLRLQLAQAEAALRTAEFAFLPTLEVTGRYEDSGLTTSGRVALAGGRPEVAIGLTYRPDDDRAWRVGVGATFRVRDVDVRSLASAEASVADARAALERFTESQTERLRGSLVSVELTEEGFSLAMLTLTLAREAVGQAVGEAELRRAQTALRRADDAAERAWQRYVRAVADHLTVVDGDWQANEAEE